MRASVGKESAAANARSDNDGDPHVRPRRRPHRPDLLRRGVREEQGPPQHRRPAGFFGTASTTPSSGGGAGGANQTLPNGRVLRGLNGGAEFEYTGVDICAGDVLTAVSKTVDISERQSSLGLMLITRRETTYTNQNGEVVCRAYGTTLAY